MVSVITKNKKKKRRRCQQLKIQTRNHRYIKEQKKLITSNEYNYLDNRVTTNHYEVFYSIYRGWSVNYSACFLHPVYAVVWMRWMMMKDHILHLWKGENITPEWHCCVGVTKVKQKD